MFHSELKWSMYQEYSFIQRFIWVECTVYTYISQFSTHYT